MLRGLKQRLYLILEAGKTSDRASLIFDWSMLTLILLNTAAFVAESMPSLDAHYGTAFEVFNVVSVVIFTIEYLLRLWVCTEHPPLRGMNGVVARLRFAIRPAMIVDLLAVLPAYIAFFVPMQPNDLRFLRLLRLIRFLKLARFSPALTTLRNALYRERRALMAAIVVMGALLLISASLMHVIEGKVQPEAFGSVPAAMWWALATLTTVGYGDVVPLTPLGRIVGGLVMIFGLGMFALPVGIIATGFSQEIHRRDFVVTWGMVARVPLFQNLDANCVAEIMTILQAQIVPEGTVLYSKGDEADAMYFISIGSIELDTGDQTVALKDGDFFGETALMMRTRRPVTARAAERTHLMRIDRGDFLSFLQRHPEIREQILETAKEHGQDILHQDAG